MKLLTGKVTKKVAERRSDIAYIATTIIIGLLAIGYINQTIANHKILINQNQALIRHSETLDQLQKTQAAIEKNDNEKLADLQGHVDCLYNLATQSQSSVIAAAIACKLPQSSALSSTDSANPSSTGGSNGTDTNVGTTQTQTTTPMAAKSQTPAPAQPVKVLGIQVCIPLTGVCIDK